MKKKCTKCKSVKDEAEFGWMTAKHEKRYCQCRTCYNAWKRQWRRRNPQKTAAHSRRSAKKRKKHDPVKYRRYQRRSHLKAKFGMTIEQYDVIFAAQNGLCAICGKPETVMCRGQLICLATDHDHRTNKNRALLCNNCNNGLGRFNHSPECLERAAAYLRYHAS